MIDSDVRFYLSLAWKRLPWLLLCTVLGAALGIGAALLVVPTYRATTRILVENATIPSQLARTTVTNTAPEQLKIVREKLTTRDSLLEMADRLDIYYGIAPRPLPADMVEDMRSRMNFDQFVLESDGSGASIISISFDAKSAVLAAEVANDLAAQLLTNNTEARGERAEETIKFFERERARLSEELARVETRILAFKEANTDSLPESLEFRRDRRAAAQEQLVQLRREEASLHTRRLNIGRFGSRLVQNRTEATVSPAQQMLIDLERALVQQQAIFRPDSPTIQALEARIAALREDLRGELNPAAEDETIVDLGAELDRAEIDERLAAIDVEKEQLLKLSEQLNDSIARTPASERALNTLTRDRDNLQLQYNAVVAKLGEALIGKEIETGTGLDSISVVEQATPPSRALGPRRRLIAAGGLLLGWAFGLGVIILLELLNRTIRRPADIAGILEAPLLGTVPVLARRGRAAPRLPSKYPMI